MRTLVAFAVLCGTLMLCSGRASAALVDNVEYTTWARQKPGAKVTYEMSMNMAGMSMTQQVTHVLKSIAPDKVVVEVVTIMNFGGATNEQKQTREILSKVEETQQGVPPDVKGTVKKAGTGTVKAAGQDYECEIWDLTGESAGGSVTGKIWRSDKVPGGMVQTEMNMTTPAGAGVMKILLKEVTP